MSTLAQMLDEQNLRRLAGGRSFERGVDYAASGQVARLTRSETSVATRREAQADLYN